MERFRICSWLAVILLLPTVGNVAGWQELPRVKSTTREKSKEYKQLLQLIKDSNLPAAEKMIDFHLRNQPHNHEIWMLRRTLANALIRQQKRDQANKQLEHLVKYMLENPTESRPILRHLSSIVVSISYIQRGEEPKTSQLLFPVISLLTTASNASPSNAAYSAGVSSAVNLLARSKVRSSKVAEAISIYETELERLRKRRNQAAGNPDRWS